MEATTTEASEQEAAQSGGSAGGGDERIGTVEEVQGVVIEVAFEQDNLPEINHALEIEIEGGQEDRDEDEKTKLICEVHSTSAMTA